MSLYSFGFEGVVDTLDYEKYLYSVIYLPAEIAAQLPLAVHPRLRVEGGINDYPFSGAFILSSRGHLRCAQVQISRLSHKFWAPTISTGPAVQIQVQNLAQLD